MIIADNLINSKIEVLDKISTITDIIPSFYQIDVVTNEAKVEEIFNNHKIDGVIHFTGLKAIGESVSKPLEYYYNNLVSTMMLSVFANLNCLQVDRGRNQLHYRTLGTKYYNDPIG